MRKVALLALTVITLQAQAQKKEGNGWVFSPFVSIGETLNANSNMHYPETTESDAAFTFGANLGYMLNPHIGFFTGASYSHLDWRLITDMDDKANTTYKVTNAYYQIPLFVRFVTSKPYRVGFFADAGVNFCSLATIEVSRDGHSSSDQTGIRNRLISPFAFIGVKIPCTSKVNIHAGLNVQSSTKSFLDDDNNSDTKIYMGDVSLKVAVNILLSDTRNNTNSKMIHGK